MALDIRLKRAYEPPGPEDGRRILVERLWPRGISKTELALDDWLKALAPSTELRQWYHHDSTRWEAFQVRYRDELRGQVDVLDGLYQQACRQRITFVFAAKDPQHNSAVVLKQVLEERAGGQLSPY